jgi:hypothetical protein
MKLVAVFALILGLTLPSMGLAEDNAWLTPQNGKKLSEAIARVKDNAPVEINISIDIDPHPKDNGGNLFLVGFENVDEYGKPLSNTAPSDFRQLGIWVQEWPFTQEIELIQGLHYMALYGYSEYPSPNDMISETTQVSTDSNGPLKLVIQPTQTPKPNTDTDTDSNSSIKGTPPLQVETKTILPEDLQEQPVTLTVIMEAPLTEWVGTVFLTGFSNFDTILRMPNRDSTPEHFLTLRTAVQEFPLVVEAQLKPDLAYFAMIGNGSHPQPGDRMSRAVVFEGGDSLEITILNQIVGEPPPEAPPEAIASKALAKEPGEAMGPTETNAPKGKKRLLFGFAASGVLFALWRKGRSSKPQGIRSRLERVGESDKSS